MEKQMTPTEKLIAKVLALDEKATKGLICLPSDNCVFEVGKIECVFCGRKSGSLPDTFNPKLQAVTDLCTAAPVLAKMLKKAIEQRDARTNPRMIQEDYSCDNRELDAIAKGEN